MPIYDDAEPWARNNCGGLHRGPPIRGGRLIVSKTMKPTRQKRARPRADERATAHAGHVQGPDVSSEERHRMGECCAFFRAEQYREAGPGQIRSDDIDVAEAEIEAVI